MCSRNDQMCCPNYQRCCPNYQCNRLNDFQTYEDARNPLAERIVDSARRKSTSRCQGNRYHCNNLPKFTAHLVDKMVQPNEYGITECVILDLIQDYNCHIFGQHNSKQFRLPGGN